MTVARSRPPRVRVIQRGSHFSGTMIASVWLLLISSVFASNSFTQSPRVFGVPRGGGLFGGGNKDKEEAPKAYVFSTDWPGIQSSHSQPSFTATLHPVMAKSTPP